MSHRWRFTFVGIFVMVFAACSETPTPGLQIGAPPTFAPSLTSAAPASITLTVMSTVFSEGGNIPKKFTCDGEGKSPELKWTGAPASTKSFALILDDPDAPVSGGFVHWVLFDVPASQTELPEGAKNIGKEGKNGTGRIGYTAPCPPSGTHRYFFKTYALDLGSLNLSEGASREQVVAAMNGHIEGLGVMIGRYAR